MLRASLARALVRRQFSTSSSILNATHPRPPDDAPTNIGSPPISTTESQASNESPSGTHDHSSTNHPPTSDGPNANDITQTYDLNSVKQQLREWSGRAAITVRNRADNFTVGAKTTLSQLGLHLNKVTGYEIIEALKRDVVDQEAKINVTRQAARQAKTTYEEAVVQRSNSQREVNDLLQRKSNWTDSDVSRFTTLVRQDHLYEQEEVRAKAAVNEMEDAVEREFSQLMRTILARYHEEQVWSDKIRSASTYGSLAALGLNLLVFVMAIAVVEPWKRRRLAQTFEQKIEELSRDSAARVDASMKEIGKQLADQERMLAKVTQDLTEKVISTSVEVEPEKPTIEVSPEQVDVLVGRNWELAAVATSAFVAGIFGCRLWLQR